MLDLSTMYVMVALASIVAGIIHVVPWATGRFDNRAAWWGFGHILLGVTLPKGGRVFGWSGDEFVCVLPDADQAGAAATAAAIVVRYAHAMTGIAPPDLPVALSINTAVGMLDRVTGLIVAADHDMYAIKLRNCTDTPVTQRSVSEMHPGTDLISHAQHG